MEGQTERGLTYQVYPGDGGNNASECSGELYTADTIQSIGLLQLKSTVKQWPLLTGFRQCRESFPHKHSMDERDRSLGNS